MEWSGGTSHYIICGVADLSKRSIVVWWPWFLSSRIKSAEDFR